MPSRSSVADEAKTGSAMAGNDSYRWVPGLGARDLARMSEELRFVPLNETLQVFLGLAMSGCSIRVANP